VLAGDRYPHEIPEVVTCALLASRATVGDPDFLPRPLYIRPPDVTMKTVPLETEICRD
jgi:hypothetical protein